MSDATVVRLMLWNVGDTGTSLDELRAAELPPTPGATGEVWFADEAGERWGGFARFADAEAAAAPVPERLRDLLGKDPDVFELFDAVP